MKERVKIKKWQLVAYRSQKPSVDLSAESFVSVGKQSFKRQKRMEELVLPCGVSAIKTEAFARCRRLKSVALSDDCNVGLSQGVFRNCIRLHEVKNTDCVTSIGKNAFYNCSSLTSINLGGTKAQWNAISKDSGWNDNTGNYTIYCTDGTISK